jgi:hypothetical protein
VRKRVFEALAAITVEFGDNAPVNLTASDVLELTGHGPAYFDDTMRLISDTTSLDDEIRVVDRAVRAYRRELRG